MKRISDLKPPIKCVSVVDNKPKAAGRSILDAFEGGARAVELRADYWEKPSKAIELGKKFRFYSLGGDGDFHRIIYTCMPEPDGGKFRGKELDRLSYLSTASRYFSVSLEYEYVPEGLNHEIMEGGGEVISTFHRYDRVLTLEEVKPLAKEMAKRSNIVKIVSSPQKKEEVDEYVLYTLWMKQNLKKPFISLIMGPHSQPWRYGSFELGSVLGFFAIDEKRKARPEQPTLDDANEVLKRFYPKI